MNNKFSVKCGSFRCSKVRIETQFSSWIKCIKLSKFEATKEKQQFEKLKFKLKKFRQNFDVIQNPRRWHQFANKLDLFFVLFNITTNSISSMTKLRHIHI